MGSVISIDNTILGQSLINRSFETKILLYYRHYEKQYDIPTDHAYLSKFRSFNDNSIKIESGMVFTVNKVERKWGIDAGFSLLLYVTIKKCIHNDFEKYNEIPIIISVHQKLDLLPQLFEFVMNPNDINFNIPIEVNGNMLESI